MGVGGAEQDFLRRKLGNRFCGQAAHLVKKVTPAIDHIAGDERNHILPVFHYQTGHRQRVQAALGDPHIKLTGNVQRFFCRDIPGSPSDFKLCHEHHSSYIF